MRFRVFDGACDGLVPGAVGTLAGHPGGLGSPYTCGCGHDDCPHKTPEGRVGHLWLDFAEDQLAERVRARRGTLPAPEPERVVCPTCDSTGLLYFKVPTEGEPELPVPAYPKAPPEADDEDTADFEVAEPSAHDPSSPEVEPGHIEVVCGHCRGTGWAPPPPPPLIPSNPLPFRAGIRADLVECLDATGRWDGPLTELAGGTGTEGYGA